MIAPALQKKVLLLLVALWVVIGAVMYFWGSKEDKPAPAPAVSKGVPARAVKAKVKSRGELDLVLWERKQEPLQAGTHNPFHPLAGYFEPPPPPPGAKVKAAPPPPDPYIEELKTFKYFGYAEDQSKKVAFLGKGKVSYTVKEKDIIESKFLVKKITEDYVVIGEPMGIKELTIAQTGFGETSPSGYVPPRPASPTPFPFPMPSHPAFTPPPTRTPPTSTSPTSPVPTPPQFRRGQRDLQFPLPPRGPLPKGGE